MHPEAKKELRARFKFIVLDHAKHAGVTKACREFEVRDHHFIVGKRDTTKKVTQAYTQRGLPQKVIRG